jgi:uncharacterized membrane protein YhaH (DUF805 family)
MSATIENYKIGWSRGFDFSGRATRLECWTFILLNVVMERIIGVVDEVFFERVSDFGVLSVLWVIVAIVPTISIMIRRLHDIGKSGYWLLTFLIPLVGQILWLVWALTKSKEPVNES